MKRRSAWCQQFLRPKFYSVVLKKQDPDYIQYWNKFLADRTNGRAYATVLRLSSSVCLSVTLCIVAKRCVLEQKSL